MTIVALPPLLLVPDDVRDHILDCVDIQSIQALRFASATADGLVASYWQARVRRLFDRYVHDVQALQDHLDACHAVVSGSSALNVIYRETWVPHDLDVYAPFDTATFIVHYLVLREGYKRATPPPRSTYVTYGPPEAIASVTRLKRGTASVDVVQACMSSALYPIASFWSTHLMNYFTPRGFTTMYHDLTASKRALLCPGRLLDKSVPDQHIITLIAKYAARGYDFKLHAYAWDPATGANTPCPGNRSPLCASTLRYIGDEHCVTCSFRAIRTVSSALCRYHNVCTTVGWIRGGWTCGATCPDTYSFVLPVVFPHRLQLYEL